MKRSSDSQSHSAGPDRRNILRSASLLALLATGSSGRSVADQQHQPTPRAASSPRGNPNVIDKKPTTTVPVDDLIVNVKEFGAVADGLTDDTLAIQAAIDYAYSKKKQAVFLPAGKYLTSGPLFLDAPGNLRGTAPTYNSGHTYRDTIPPTFPNTSASWQHNPTIFNFSMALIGDQGTGNGEGFGTQIEPNSNNFVALWVGTGQGMKVSNLSIIGPTGVDRAAMPNTGCGIGIAGGNGGASRTLIEQVAVGNFYCGVGAGFNLVGALADGNTLRQCFINNCYIGFKTWEGNAYINNLDTCNINYCKYPVVNGNNFLSINVRGGNYSTPQAQTATFTISSVSGLSSKSVTVAGNTFNTWTFTAVVSSPDSHIANGTYDAFALNLPGFGLLPCQFVSWDAGTNTVTLQIYPPWIFANFDFNFMNINTGTNIPTEVAAAATLYCAEQVTVFTGAHISVQGVHIENDQAVTTSCAASGGGIPVVFKECLWQYQIDHGFYYGNNNALFFVQNCFPFIQNLAGYVVFEDNYFETGNENVLLEGVYANGAVRTIFRNSGPFNLNVRAANFPHLASSVPEGNVFGVGEYDRSPFFAQNRFGVFFGSYSYDVPMRGFNPAPGYLPQLTPTLITTLTGTLPVIGTYPLLNGYAIYSISDYNQGVPMHLFAKSANQFYSYGQNLTAAAGNGQIAGLSLTWEGISTKINCDANTLKWMFPGLKIILNDGTNGPQGYVVTGIHYQLGYIDIQRIDPNSNWTLGTKGTRYGPVTTIGQDTYNITQFPSSNDRSR